MTTPTKTSLAGQLLPGDAHGLAGDVDYQALDTDDGPIGEERSVSWPRGV